MTEFDPKGFLAVSTFFKQNGVVLKDKKTQGLTQKEAENVPRSGPKWSRLGLGAEKLNTETTKVKVGFDRKEARKKILSVGNERKRKHLLDDENNYSNEDGGNESDDEKDEDEGRTSAVKNKIKPNINRNFDTLKTKKRKNAKRNSTDSSEPITTNGQYETEEPKIGKSVKLPVNGASTNIECEVGHEDDNRITHDELISTDNNNNNDEHHIKENKSKRKRRKIRSKQKNIRKDNRNRSQKPAHLALQGSIAYGGRPLTNETREFLKLPESNSGLKKKYRTKSKSKDETEVHLAENHGMGLGVDASPIREADEGSVGPSMNKQKGNHSYESEYILEKSCKENIFDNDIPVKEDRQANIQSTSISVKNLSKNMIKEKRKSKPKKMKKKSKYKNLR